MPIITPSVVRNERVRFAANCCPAIRQLSANSNQLRTTADFTKLYNREWTRIDTNAFRNWFAAAVIVHVDHDKRKQLWRTGAKAFVSIRVQSRFENSWQNRFSLRVISRSFASIDGYRTPFRGSQIICVISGSNRRQIAFDQAIPQTNNTASVFGDRLLVCYQDDRIARLV